MKSATTVGYEILRELRRSGSSAEGDKLLIECAPRVAELINARDRDYLDALEKKYQKKLEVVAQKGWKPDQYRVAGKMSSEIAAQAAAEAPAHHVHHKNGGTQGGGSGGAAGGGRRRRRRGGRGRDRAEA